jgi:hypothetical protein
MPSFVMKLYEGAKLCEDAKPCERFYQRLLWIKRLLFHEWKWSHLLDVAVHFGDLDAPSLHTELQAPSI